MPGPVLGGLHLGAEIVTPKLVLPVGAVGHAPTRSLAGAPRQCLECSDKQEEIWGVARSGKPPALTGILLG